MKKLKVNIKGEEFLVDELVHGTEILKVTPFPGKDSVLVWRKEIKDDKDFIRVTEEEPRGKTLVDKDWVAQAKWCMLKKQRFEKRKVYVSDLIVNTRYTKRGIGSDLHGLILEYAEKKGAELVLISAYLVTGHGIRSDKEENKKFYLSRGYKMKKMSVEGSKVDVFVANLGKIKRSKQNLSAY